MSLIPQGLLRSVVGAAPAVEVARPLRFLGCVPSLSLVLHNAVLRRIAASCISLLIQGQDILWTFSRIRHVQILPRSIPIWILSLHLLLLADVLDELVFLVLLAHVILVELQLAPLSTASHQLRDNTADEDTKEANQTNHPWIFEDSS